MKNRKIIITNFSAHDYEIALRETGPAELVPASVGNVNPVLVDRLLFQFIATLLKHNVEEEDYLLLSGPPICNAIGMAAWLQFFPKCKLLIWDSKTSGYGLKEVTRKQMQSTYEKLSDHFDDLPSMEDVL